MTFWGRLARKLETAASSCAWSSSTFVRFALLDNGFPWFPAPTAAARREFLMASSATAKWPAAGESVRRKAKEGDKDGWRKKM